MAFDWKYVGIDLGGLALQTPDDSIVAPRVGFRIGPPGLFVSSSVFENHPLISNGGYANIGIGTEFGPFKVWTGAGAGPGELSVGILRLGYNVQPLTLHLSLQGPFPFDNSKYTLDQQNGISFGAEIRLP